MASKRVGIKNRIHRVGVELEGAWTKPPAGMRREHIIRDGSLEFPDLRVERVPLEQRLRNPAFIVENAPAPRMPDVLVGEIPSPVLEVGTYADWMLKHYPQHVNETCGLHAHVSFFFKLNYMRLMTPEFTPYVVKGLLEWAEEEKLPKAHPIWPRLLRKDHRHCAHIYLGDNQVRQVGKDFNSRGKPHSRYTALNYCWSADPEGMGKGRGTVECRLLPMMETAEQAVRGVGEFFSLTNKFLAKMRAREPRKEAKVILSLPIESKYRIRVGG
jgi:hypothetical protein